MPRIEDVAEHYVPLNTPIYTVCNQAGTNLYSGFFTDGDPNGSVTGSIGDRCYDYLSQLEYKKTSGNGTNTGWTLDTAVTRKENADASATSISVAIDLDTGTYDHKVITVSADVTLTFTATKNTDHIVTVVSNDANDRLVTLSGTTGFSELVVAGTAETFTLTRDGTALKNLAPHEKIVESVAAAKTTAFWQGQTIRTKYHSGTIENSGNEYFADYSSSATADEVCFVLTALRGRLIAKEQTVAYLPKWGAHPDGTNSAATVTAVQAAVDAAEVIDGLDGTYLLETQVTFTASRSDLRRTFRNATLTSGAANRMLVFTAGVEATTTVTANVRPGGASITVASAAGIQEGDLLTIVSDDPWRYDPRGVAVKGETNRVDVISGTVLTLSNPAFCDYVISTETVEVKAYPPAEFKVQNVKCLCQDVATGVGLVRTVGGLVESCEFRDSPGNNLAVNESFGASVANCAFHDNYAPGLGYGIQTTGSSRVVVSGCTAGGNRRAIDFSGVWPSHACSAIGNTVAAIATESSMGTHGPANFCTFANNHITGGSVGIISRSPNSVITGNVFQSAGSACIQVSGGQGVKISNNYAANEADLSGAGAPNGANNAWFLQVTTVEGEDTDLWSSVRDVFEVTGNTCHGIRVAFIRFNTGITRTERMNISNNNVTIANNSGAALTAFIECVSALTFEGTILDNKVLDASGDYQRYRNFTWGADIDNVSRWTGAGSPEGVYSEPTGSQYLRTGGSTGTGFYVKQSGVGNTGWAAVPDLDSVATVAALATAEPADGSMIDTLGYYVPNDGGGNTFRYDAGSSATIDGGFVIDGPGSVGRYVAVDQTVVRLKQFGCLGGVTDDTTQLTAAAAALTDGATFEIDGDYQFSGASGALTITNDDVDVVGSGSIVSIDSSVSDVVSITGDSVTWDGPGVTGSGDYYIATPGTEAVRYALVLIDNAADTRIIRGFFSEPYMCGLRFNVCDNAYVGPEVIIEGGTSSQVLTYHQSIRLFTCSRTVVDNPVIRSNAHGKTDIGVLASGCSDVKIKVRVFETWDNGVYAISNDGLVVHDCHCESDGNAIAVSPPEYSVNSSTQTKIVHNMCVKGAGSGPGAALIGLYLRDMHNAVVTDNQVIGYERGYQIGGVQYSNVLNRIENIVFANNAAKDWIDAGLLLTKGAGDLGAISDIQIVNFMSTPDTPNIKTGAGEGAHINASMPADLAENIRVINPQLSEGRYFGYFSRVDKLSIFNQNCRDATVYGWYVSEGDDLLIDGGTIWNGGTDAMRIITGCNRPVVKNVTVDSDSGTNAFAINNQATAVDGVYENNTFRNTTSPPYRQTNNCLITGAGDGTPELNVAAKPGSTWSRTDGGAGTAGYKKEIGTGTSGWTAFPTAHPTNRKDGSDIIATDTFTIDFDAADFDNVEIVLTQNGAFSLGTPADRGWYTVKVGSSSSTIHTVSWANVIGSPPIKIGLIPAIVHLYWNGTAFAYMNGRKSDADDMGTVSGSVTLDFESGNYDNKVYECNGDTDFTLLTPTRKGTFELFLRGNSTTRRYITIATTAGWATDTLAADLVVDSTDPVTLTLKYNGNTWEAYSVTGRSRVGTWDTVKANDYSGSIWTPLSANGCVTEWKITNSMPSGQTINLTGMFQYPNQVCTILWEGIVGVGAAPTITPTPTAQFGVPDWDKKVMAIVKNIGGGANTHVAWLNAE